MSLVRCFVGALLLSVPLCAQTAVTTSNGATNAIPKFTGAATVGNSAITETNGNVAIGRSSDGRFNAGGQSVFGDGAIDPGFGVVQIIGAPPSLAFHNPGNTIGQIYLSKDLYGNTFKFVAGNSGVDGPMGIDVQGNAYFGNGGVNSASANPFIQFGSSGDRTLGAYHLDFQGFRDVNSLPYYITSSIYSDRKSPCCGNNEVILTDLVFATRGDWNNQSKYGNLTDRMRITAAGNVGIHTNSPSAPLEVNGDILLTLGTDAKIIFPDQTTQTTAWTGGQGGDFAESVDVVGDRQSFVPGDLLEIDPKNHGHFLKPTKPYSRLVSGVFATKPGFVGRRQDPHLPKTGEVPMAMVGIVPTKVSTENGPISDGDLLVSSSQPGYAMRGTDPQRLVGAVIGKALGSLESGEGVIEVLISLQ